MKILIIDDETIVRIGMRNVIPWEKHGYEVVGEASNGKEALELARRYKPDIVLTDIVMPEMNGLDFIEKIKNELPFTKFIIFSCHDNVEFYKKAIKLGVSEYIQKSSVSPQEILESVDIVAKKIKIEYSGRYNLEQENLILHKKNINRQLFNFIISEMPISDEKIQKYTSTLGLGICKKQSYIIIFKANYSELTDKIYNGEYDQSIYGISGNIIQDDEMFKGLIFSVDTGFFICLVIFESITDYVEEHLKNTCFQIRENIKQIFDLDLTFGISGKIKDVSALHEAYLNAIDALESYYIHGQGNIYFHTFVKDSEKVFNILAEQKKKIQKMPLLIEDDIISEIIFKIQEISLSDYSVKSRNLKPLYMDILYHITNSLRNDDINIEDVLGGSYNPIEFIEGPKTLKTLNKKIIYLLESIKKYYSDKIKSRGQKIINQINTYINDNISEHIRLENLAAVVYLNPSYLSRFYKKVTGNNIQKYIQSVKVEKAKGFLLIGCSISHIIEKTGFFSESYFFKVFKKYTGFTPKQFKNSKKKKL